MVALTLCREDPIQFDRSIATGVRAPDRAALVRTCLLWATPVLLYLFVFINAYLGRDFGLHWDEYIFASFVDDTYRGGGLLPNRYIYPSFCYYLSLGCGILFNFLYELPRGFSYTDNQDFIRFCRVAYAAVASLSVVWVYGTAFALTKKFRYACLAGLILCGSFEFSYHARWAVSDLIAVQFVCLAIMIACLDLDRRQRLLFGALAVGLAAGTKYTAGIAGVTLLVRFFSEDRSPSWMRWRWVYACLALVTFSAAFFLTTPGSVLQFHTFMRDLNYQRTVYANGHFIYTVEPGAPHLAKMLGWLVFFGQSSLPFVSALLAGLGGWGAWRAFRQGQARRLSLFLIIALYLAFFATYRVMVVRNLMIVIPLSAVLAACGFQSLVERIHRPRLARAMTSALFLLLMVSAIAVARASLSVQRKGEINLAMALDEYLDHHPGRAYAFSPKVLPMVSVPVSTEPREDRYLVFRKDEIQWAPEHLQANEFMLYETIGGPFDVNINYYPAWPGDDRLLIMEYRRAPPGSLADLGFR